MEFYPQALRIHIIIIVASTTQKQMPPLWGTNIYFMTLYFHSRGPQAASEEIEAIDEATGISAELINAFGAEELQKQHPVLKILRGGSKMW